MEFLFAYVPGSVEQIAIRCMAVAGAFLIGNFTAGVVMQFLGKFYFKRILPTWAIAWTRIASGLTLAIIAALILFGDGGYGLGGSGGGKPGGPQTPERKEKSDEKKDKETPEKEVVIPPMPSDEVKSIFPARIVVLGGAQKEDRFYILDEAKEGVTFERLKDILLQRRKDSVKPLQRIDILVYKDSAYRDSYLVKQLEIWAKDNRLSVNFPPVAGDTMPER